jgi:uncharacterized protein
MLEEAVLWVSEAPSNGEPDRKKQPVCSACRASAMIIRALTETVRTVVFRRKYHAIRANAVAKNQMQIEPVGNGFLIPDIQEYHIVGINGAYRIFVVAPVAPPPPGGYPVLYLLDGNAWIGGAAEALRLQARFAKQSNIEPMMIVAVGYPGANPIDLGRRAYDYLPPHSSQKLSARFMQGAPWHQPGGADAFLDFLTGQLRQAIQDRYPVNSKRSTLCGHSFGGFFTLHTMLTRSDIFQKYAALSPALWWDDGRMGRESELLIRSLAPSLNAEVLICVGEKETPDRPKISQRMIDDAVKLARHLEQFGPVGVRTTCQILEDETHQSVPVTALSRVLRFATKSAL